MMLFSGMIIVFLLIGAVHGYRTGLLLQVSSLISMVLAVIFAMYYSHDVTNWVTRIMVKYFHQSVSVAGNYITYVVVFVTLMLIVSGVFQSVGRWLNKINRWPLIGWGNSLLGIVAGVVISYLVILIGLNLLLATQSPWVHQQYTESQLAQLIVKPKVHEEGRAE